MVLEWLSRILDGFKLELDRFNPSTVWSGGSDSLYSNIFQTSQLRKFTTEYTHDLNVQNVNTKMELLSQFSHAEQAVNRVNQQKQVDLNFINSEIKTLENFVIPIPNIQPVTIHHIRSRRASNRILASYTNPQDVARFASQTAEFNLYKNNALKEISKSLDFFIGKRDLITATRFSL